jgi:hypothetical protein
VKVKATPIVGSGASARLHSLAECQHAKGGKQSAGGTRLHRTHEASYFHFINNYEANLTHPETRARFCGEKVILAPWCPRHHTGGLASASEVIMDEVRRSAILKIWTGGVPLGGGGGSLCHGWHCAKI